MKLHYVYYAIKKDGKEKVGATCNLKFRPRIGKYQDFKVLEAYECPIKCGDREIELQELYFGKRDSKLHYSESLKLSVNRAKKAAITRKRNGTKIAITTKDIKKGHITQKKNDIKYSSMFRGVDNGVVPPKPHLEKKSVGVNHKDAKLNPDKVIAIRQEFRDIRYKCRSNNQAYQSLADNYGISFMAIKKVVDRISWKHIK